MEMGQAKKKEDQRILTICSMVQGARRVIEVGADHGLISLHLASRKDIGEILATDLSASSLSKLERVLANPAVQKVDASRKIHLHVGDGLKDLPWDWADCLILSGMGGSLILSILEGNFSFAKKTNQWILGPQSDMKRVRTFLIQKGLSFHEEMAEEGGKFYPLLDVRPEEDLEDFDQKALPSSFMMEYGPDLLQKRDPKLLRLLQRDQKKIEEILFKLDASESTNSKRRADLVRRKKEIQAYLEKNQEKQEEDYVITDPVKEEK